MRWVFYLILLMIVMFGITLASLNANIVSFNYYFAKKDISLALLLSLTFGIGIVTGFVFSFPAIIKAKVDNYRLKQLINKNTKELSESRKQNFVENENRSQ